MTPFLNAVLAQEVLLIESHCLVPSKRAKKQRKKKSNLPRPPGRGLWKPCRDRSPARYPAMVVSRATSRCLSSPHVQDISASLDGSGVEGDVHGLAGNYHTQHILSVRPFSDTVLVFEKPFGVLDSAVQVDKGKIL